jgi:hypothetical protein
MDIAATCIVAYTGENEHLSAVREAAVKVATSSNAQLILYDVDAASVFAKPLPTGWSANQDELPTRLTAEGLEHAGRHGMANHVRAAMNAGIEAYGWLPGDKSGDSLADYARQQRADLIMVPRELDDPGIIDKLMGVTLAHVEDHTRLPIAIVDTNGDIEMT